MTKKDTARPLEGHKILVVDDEQAVRDILARSLERAGYRIVVAGSGAAALRLARSERPDAIVLDMRLPDVSGFQVIQQLRTHRALQDIPVLLVSGGVLEGTPLEMGRVETLEKPMRPAELVRRVGRLLRPAGSSRELPGRPPSLNDFPE